MTVRSYSDPKTAPAAGSGASGARWGGKAVARQTRSEADFAAANRHSRRVQFLKFGLPLAALFATGFFAAATLLAGSGVPAPSFQSVAMSDGRIVMAEPKMEGFDADKRPYKMNAERAIQQSASSSIVDLEKITADLPFGKAGTAKLTADSGAFDNAANKLDLKGNISFATSDGTVAALSKAKINLAANEMSSDAPVDIVTQGSHITADRMRIGKGGKVFVFEGRVRLNVDAKKVKQASDTSAEPGG